MSIITVATLASSDFVIDNGETTEDNIVVHEGILTDPVPR
jgi:hypothetical protein